MGASHIHWHLHVPLFGAEAEGTRGATREAILLAQQKLLQLLLHLCAGDCTCDNKKQIQTHRDQNTHTHMYTHTVHCA